MTLGPDKLDDVLNNNFFSFKYKVVAFKIIEKDLIYFVNLNLSEKEFNKLKKL